MHPDPSPSAEPLARLDPRVPLASERTLLAWMRTGVALMGLGFVVGRFGLFMRELAMVRGTDPARHAGVSEVLGVLLILLGVLANVLAPIKHHRFMVRLQRDEPFRPATLSMAAVFATALAGVGLAVAGYLVWSSH